MPKYGLILVILISSFSLFSQNATYELEVNAMPLEKVILQLENSYSLLFSYKEEDIKDLQITAKIKSTQLDDFFITLLQNTPLEFEIVNDNYIIFSQKGTGKQQLSEQTRPTPPDLTLLCGSVIDSFTQEPLPAANVYLKRSQKGAISTDKGSFRFRAALAPNDTLVISYVGFEEKRVPASDFIKRPCQTVELTYFDFGEDFVVVTEYLTDGIQLGENGAATLLEPSRIGTFPGQVEPDVLSTIQFLPGISSPDGEASNIYIRGGTPDQNLILWEDIPIYHSAHYFGMISAFNPYIIDKVKVYRGGFGADYGGRVSGVINLKSADHTSAESQFGAGFNFINGYTDGKVSLLDKKLSLVYSLRHSIKNIWTSPTFANITERNEQGLIFGDNSLSQLPDHIKVKDEVQFFDTHLKASARISKKDDLTVAWFYGSNEFKDVIIDDRQKLDQKDSLDLSNSGISVAWERKWRDNWSSKVVGLSTQYEYNYNFELKEFRANNPDRVGSKNNKINEQQLHFSNRYTSKKGYEIKLGYHFTKYDFAYQIDQESRNSPDVAEGEAYKSDLHVAYIAFKTADHKKLGFEAGLRYSYYQKTERFCPEPRLQLWYQATDDLRLQASAGKYFQFMSQLIEFKGNQTGLNTPIWVLAGDKDVPVLDANQVQLGFIFQKKSWVVDLQVYYKNINGLTSLATGFDPTPGRGYDLGMTKVRGVDLLVKKRWKNFRSWVSYSLGEANYHFKTFFDSEFRAPFNQRHIFNWVNMYKHGNFEYSLGWKIQSGKPYSLLNDFEVVRDPMGKETTRLIYESYNSKTLPVQHLLNASILYHIRPKNEGRWKGIVGLSLFNIYHQTNTFSRDYYISGRRNEPRRIESYDKVGLGFTPNAVFRFEW